MEQEPWLNSHMAYGHELIHSAVEGARSAREHALANQPVSAVLRRSARGSLTMMAIGASIGLLALYSARKQRTTRNQVLFSMVGAIVGFGTNLALSTRELTGEMVHEAVRNINTVRDAHWLAKHPIDYA